MSLVNSKVRAQCMLIDGMNVFLSIICLFVSFMNAVFDLTIEISVVGFFFNEISVQRNVFFSWKMKFNIIQCYLKKNDSLNTFGGIKLLDKLPTQNVALHFYFFLFISFKNCITLTILWVFQSQKTVLINGTVYSLNVEERKKISFQYVFFVVPFCMEITSQQSSILQMAMCEHLWLFVIHDTLHLTFRYWFRLQFSILQAMS